jgi:hypothetical protein
VVVEEEVVETTHLQIVQEVEVGLLVLIVQEMVVVLVEHNPLVVQGGLLQIQVLQE